MLEQIRSLFKKKIVKDSGIYTGSRIVSKAIPFLLLPVVTRYLSPEDYGIVSMFSVLIGITIPFVGLNAQASVFRSYYKKEIDFPVYVANSLFILTGCSFIAVIIYLAFSGIISKISGFPANWLLLVVLVSVFQFFINLILVIWMAKKKSLYYGFFQILLSLVNIGTSIFLIVNVGLEWQGMVLGTAIAVIIFGLFGFFILYKDAFIKFKLNIGYMKHSIGYSGPLIPHVISGIAISMTDRLFITNMIGLSATGLYTVGYQVGMIIGVLAGAFNKAWTPWLFEKLEEGKEAVKYKIVKYTYFYFLLIILLALILSFTASWFLNFFIGEEFYGATEFVIWIAVGYAFRGMYFMVVGYFMYTERTSFISGITFLVAFINIVLNYFLIKNFGPIGAAQATTVSLFIQFALTWFWATKVHRMPWLRAWKKITFYDV